MKFIQLKIGNRQHFIASILKNIYFASSPIHQLSSHRDNKSNNLMVEPGVLILLPVWSWFLHFLYMVAALVRVNIWSIFTHECTTLLPRYITDSPCNGEEQPHIKNRETSFCMEEEVESLVPQSNGYFY